MQTKLKKISDTHYAIKQDDTDVAHVVMLDGRWNLLTDEGYFVTDREFWSPPEAHQYYDRHYLI